MSEMQVPVGWGQDSLSAFIDKANRNSFGVFVHHKDWFTRLQDIDATFEQFFADFLSPPGFIEPFMFIRAHSCFRGAARLSTSGHLPEAYTLMRGAIECALYGFYFHKSPQTIQTWIQRDDSDAGKKQARKDLAFGPLLNKFDAADAEMGKVVRHLYEFTIDVGAHPNRKTITLATEQIETEEHITYNLAQLNPDEIPLVGCLKTNAQVGVCVLQVFGLVFPDRYKELVLANRITELSKGL